MFYLNELQQDGVTFIPRWTPSAKDSNDISESGVFIPRILLALQILVYIDRFFLRFSGALCDCIMYF